ncbi:MAG: hypothetical protein RR630_01050 [Coprobacillus sp.]
MPIKVYSQEQKESIKLQLLDTALHMYSKHGIRNVTLMDVLKSVGISKPFFYTFYESVQEFVICVLEYQWTKFPKFFEEIDSRTDLSWEDQIYMYLKGVTYYSDTGFLIMTQEEEVWIRKHIDDNRYQGFMNDQVKYFEDLLIKWGVPDGKCNPKVLANMILTMILIHSSSKHSLPFFYIDDLDETAKAHAKSIIEYLRALKSDEKSIL